LAEGLNVLGLGDFCSFEENPNTFWLNLSDFYYVVEKHFNVVLGSSQHFVNFFNKKKIIIKSKYSQ